MRNDYVGFRVLDKNGAVMTDWGRLVLADLIPGDECWGRLVFVTARKALVERSGVPETLQIAVNTYFPSELYDIYIYEGNKTVRRGKQIEADRVTIDIEGNKGVWITRDDQEDKADGQEVEG